MRCILVAADLRGCRGANKPRHGDEKGITPLYGKAMAALRSIDCMLPIQI
jgi:hypothetical protein